MFQVYPYHDVKNVIETGFKVEIPNWPKFDGPDPDTTGDHKVTPFKCLGKNHALKVSK
ncbi:hypothetical protein DPMN_074907 [Dreissena polymorpha]|uniref:Amyloidogenic glycoprotein heparin-binding domain-containing protein n=1 Tax=Dreissena polymorpha TaxID=45954 RepID=A0A9D4BM50_DREPO|nr:hypothetical protein DPMN_074907 [Dreissena polymorpha]